MHNQPRLTVLVLEYVTAGGFVGTEIPHTLLHEGLLMRDALLTDLVEAIWPNSACNCITTHDARVSAPTLAQSVALDAQSDIWQIWHELMNAVVTQVIWIIAPECDDILLKLTQMAMTSKKKYIGCSLEAIRITSSKMLTANYFAQYDISVIPTYSLATFLTDLVHTQCLDEQAWVVKPDDGAGCTDTYYFTDKDSVSDWCSKKNPLTLAQLVIQPYVAGEALSISVLASAQQAQVLAANTQFINLHQGQFSYEGAGMHQAHLYLADLQVLATKIHTALSGLRAYWGADLIRTKQGQYILVEINPRLTTPYVQLRHMLGKNTAKLIFDAVVENMVENCTAQYAFDWHPHPINTD